MNNNITITGIMQKGYGQISKLVMQDNSISIQSKGLYAYICSYTGGGKSAFPTRDKICHDLNVSKDSVSKYLKELTNKKYITIIQNKEKGKFSNNTYIVNLEISYNENIGYEKIVSENIGYEKIDTNNNNSNNNSINNSNSINTITCQQIVDLYHEICHSYPKLRSITSSREKHIKSRIKEYNDNIEVFKELFQKAEDSDFLKGKNDNKWKANFDWLINSTNMAKVLENNYENKKTKSKLPVWNRIEE